METEPSVVNLGTVSAKQNNISQKKFPNKVSSVQPVSAVGQGQVVQQLRVALAEIEELKQSLRYVEIQLAKS